MVLTVQLWDLSVLNHWQQSIHKLKFTSSLWDFPQGAASPCQNDTAPGPTSNTGKTERRLLTWTLMLSVFALVARSTGKTEHFSWPLSACVCVCACASSAPLGYDEKQFRPGWLFPVLVLLHTGCVIILPQFRETGLMRKQVTFPLEQIQKHFGKLAKVSNGSVYWFQQTLLLWGCICHWVSHTTPAYRGSTIG